MLQRKKFIEEMALQNFLIAGLGNIGPEYEKTRHNIGFMIVDKLVKERKGTFESRRYAYHAKLAVKGKNVHVIKPTTYMNLSGKAIRYWLKETKTDIAGLLVILDDLAIPFGSIRLRAKGSDAGHNGLKSINENLGTSDYARLRFGIGNNFPRGHQAAYVLSEFDSSEEAQLPELIHHSVEMIESFVTAGCALTMTKYNK